MITKQASIREKQPFLIIGAMKSGSTSIYSLLKQIDNIYLPDNKEPRTLTTDKVFEEIEKYHRLIGLYRNEYFIGEASTYYTKYPEYKDVPERAFKILGSHTKIIYIVRDPIKRAISHANHDISMNIILPSLAKELLLTESRYANYSNYKLQLNQWMRKFSHKNILVIKLENFIIDPEREIDRILLFLGVQINKKLNYDVRENASTKKLVPIPLIRRLVVSEFYRNRIKNLIPSKVTKFIKRLVSKKMQTVDIKLSSQEINFFLETCDGLKYHEFDFNDFLKENDNKLEGTT